MKKRKIVHETQQQQTNEKDDEGQVQGLLPEILFNVCLYSEWDTVRRLPLVCKNWKHLVFKHVKDTFYPNALLEYSFQYVGMMIDQNNGNVY